MRGSRVAGQASGREDFGPAGAVPHRVYLSRPFLGRRPCGRARWPVWPNWRRPRPAPACWYLWGCPLPGTDGWIIAQQPCTMGEVQATIPKTHIPNYSEFYESRYFAPAPEGFGWVSGFWSQGRDVPFGKNVLFTHGELPELSVGCEICEDLWAPRQPSQDLALAGATIIVNLSASPAVIGERNLSPGSGGQPICPADVRVSLRLRLLPGVHPRPGVCRSQPDCGERHHFGRVGNHGSGFSGVGNRCATSDHRADTAKYLLRLQAGATAGATFGFSIEPTLLTRTIDPHPLCSCRLNRAAEPL